MDIYKINNKYYGLSQLTTYGSVMVYNKDMFDTAGLKHPPVDWEVTPRGRPSACWSTPRS